MATSLESHHTQSGEPHDSMYKAITQPSSVAEPHLFPTRPTAQQIEMGKAEHIPHSGPPPHCQRTLVTLQASEPDTQRTAHRKTKLAASRCANSDKCEHGGNE